MKKYCSLSFDDGPNTIITPLVLDKLEKYGVTASFFAVGKNITDVSAEVMKRAVSIGCEIENHSETHFVMTKLSQAEIKAEIGFTNKKIEEITGRTPKLFRPPYIAVDEKMHKAIDMTFISGVGCDDWNREVSVESRINTILGSVKDGDIILLHDSDYNISTVNALDAIICGLKETGFEMVTTSELFKIFGVIPQKNIVYKNVIQ